jgi:hypothetical protein
MNLKDKLTAKTIELITRIKCFKTQSELEMQRLKLEENYRRLKLAELEMERSRKELEEYFKQE